MRILIYTHEFIPFVGGIATYGREIAAGLAELGQEVMVLAPRYEGLEEPDTEARYRIRRFRRRGKGLGRALWSAVVFTRAWQSFHPDLALVPEGRAHVGAALGSMLFPMNCVPVIIGTEVDHHFTSDTFPRRVRGRVMEQFFLRCNRIISISEFTKRLLLSRLPVRPGTVETVHIGIRERRSHCRESLESLRQAHGLQEEHKVIMTLARLTPRKGQDRVIEAMPRILARFPRAKYLVVGGGEYREALEHRAHDLGLLGSSVLFAGRVPDGLVPLYYALSDVFVMASRPDRGGVEGFGISLVEAGQAGKPVVAGCHGGVTEVVVDGESGLLVDPQNVGEIAAAVCRILEDDEFAERMGARGRQRAEDMFSRDNMARQTLGVLRRASLPGE